MALGVALKHVTLKNAGGMRICVAKFTGDAAIPQATDGYSVTKTELQFPGGVIWGMTTEDLTGTYFTTYDPATGKFRWFIAATAVEAAQNAAGVNGKVVYGLFFGF